MISIPPRSRSIAFSGYARARPNAFHRPCCSSSQYYKAQPALSSESMFSPSGCTGRWSRKNDNVCHYVAPALTGVELAAELPPNARRACCRAYTAWTAISPEESDINLNRSQWVACCCIARAHQWTRLTSTLIKLGVKLHTGSTGKEVTADTPVAGQWRRSSSLAQVMGRRYSCANAFWT